MKTKIMTAMLAGFAATGALASDLPRKTAPVAPFVPAISTFTWTGFYAGVNAGYGFGKFTGSVGKQFKDPSGFVGGGQIGYNYQVGSLVYGLEADLDYADLNSKGKASIGTGAKDKENYLGTIRGRLGYAVDRFLPYVTAGFAYGGNQVSVPGIGKSTTVNYGYTAGAGVEYAFTNNISAKLEGLYVNLADKKVLGNTGKNGFDGGIVRAGVNYKF